LHVGHALDAVDDLLERRRDGALHGLRIGACVEGGDLHGGRREFRVARDRQRRDGDGAPEDDEQRADRREDGPADEKVREHGYEAFCSGVSPAGAPGAAGPPTMIGAPSWIFWVPPTMSSSPGARPSSTTYSLPTISPSVTAC